MDRLSGNPVGDLGTYAQRHRLPLEFKDLGSDGPDHMKVYTQGVVLAGKTYPCGKGNSKKDARRAAAQNALECLLKDQHQDTAGDSPRQQGQVLAESVADICDKTSSLNISKEETNYIGIINHYCQKTNCSPTYIEVERRGPPHNPRFFYKLKIDTKDYPVAEGKTAKEAKQNAAKEAWSALQEQSDFNSKVSVTSTSEDETSFSQSATEESTDSSLQSMQMTSSQSIIFTDSSNPFSAQNDEENHIIGNASTPSVESRFTSDFEFISVLGKGGYGAVFKVKEKLLDMDYAVKIVSASDSEKALREVKTLSDLQHENIVRYYHCWIEDSKVQQEFLKKKLKRIQCKQYLFIKMELCNSTLKQWIKVMNENEVQYSQRGADSLPIAKQIVTGVAYIHNNNLIHRDLKPDNIMFGKDGKVKIGDFGLITIDQSEELMERTKDIGTETYMAPEQNTSRYDRKVDMFALGLIFFELLWKMSLGHERSVLLRNAKKKSLPEDFSQTFPFECKIIKSLLCEDPNERLEASQVTDKLEELGQPHPYLENHSV
ncbi:PREDICTED: interferon-induced, double-stranded RNA-activated protein kinase-like [Cyprinodon variegatus]|uniref:interferon-induced, double-stranded RNA-activated protein kinase-like n=1 Tax=Cyprinodon variegatus TaxID=28743 RepID=UPI0007424DC3|nr:PREDICTED: interferon-induced, double-stranded RNA-activated protein kinase-like [Cyprinodon variegatus]